MSGEGTIIHRATSVSSNNVVLVDFDGNPTPLTDDPIMYDDVRLSPDQRKLALSGRHARDGIRRI